MTDYIQIFPSHMQKYLRNKCNETDIVSVMASPSSQLTEDLEYYLSKEVFFLLVRVQPHNKLTFLPAD